MTRIHLLVLASALFLGSLPSPAGAQSASCRLINQGDSITPEAAKAKPPIRIRGPQPVRPETPMARRDGGLVELIFVVGCDGRVDSSSIAVKSASDSAFIAPALVAMAKTEFAPATSGGKKVAMRVLQRVAFDVDAYYTRDGTAISMAEAEALQRYDAPNCPLIPHGGNPRELPPGATPAQYLRGPTPQYPRKFMSRGIPGKVSMRFIVNCEGRVEPSSIIVTSFSDTAFVRPAIRAIEGSTFSPGTLNGQRAAQLIDQALRWQVAGALPLQEYRPRPWWASQCQGEACRSPRP